MFQLSRVIAGVAAAVCCFGTAAYSQPAPNAKPDPEIHTLNIVHAPAAAIVALDQRLPITKLSPAKIVPNLCSYQYRVTTASPECQAFVDQSLGYYYSYVWMEAARSAETALRYDKNCAYAWFILHRAIEKWGKGDANKPLTEAQDLLPKANSREKLIIQSKLEEKGIWLGVKPEDRKKKAAATLDELLTLYEDDEEGWFARAQINGGNEGVVHYRALLRINPLHPGANHELVHYFEGYKRPALGWPYAEAYIASSPGIPHAWHMQAHLAMRIGKWGQTTDRSAEAVRLEKAYHQQMNVKPADDHQYAHHLETLLRGVLHDGRFAEAREIVAEAKKSNYKSADWQALFLRLYLADHNWAEIDKIIAEDRKFDKTASSYTAALMYLERGETDRAAAEVDVIRQAQQKRKTDKKLEQKLWEVQGWLMCQQGSTEAGPKLMQRCVEKTKDDYTAHAWGHGAYFMEQWGLGALEAGNAAAAEEAFLEALAHDSGSVRGALGMQALCDRLGRIDEARNFGKVAERCWAKADRKDFESLKSEFVKAASHVPSDSESAVSVP
jgi:hypothetical protein